MAAAPLYELDMHPGVYEGAHPELRLIRQEGAASATFFDTYLALREEAAAVEKIDGEALTQVQEQSRAWIDERDLLALPESQEERLTYYTEYDEARVRGKLLAFTDYLEAYHGDKVSDVELEATRAFVNAAFTMYEDEPSDDRSMADADGSFAFVVPARMSRNDKEYGEEAELSMPALRYLPNELRAQMIVGLPPFVIDTYQRDPDTGKRGYLIFAPVFGDSIEDLSDARVKLGAARHNVNEAVDFAHRRLGVEVVGLGATLPSLTMYGKTITNNGVITTTGHGGTAELISRVMEQGLQGREPSSIGVLGVGAIGASVAEVLADRHPDAEVSIHDANTSQMERVALRSEGRLTPADSGASLLLRNEVIVSAITGRFNFEDAKLDALPGTLIIDDAQPASFDPEAVEARGGKVLWVIGSSDGSKTVASRTGYDYATLMDKHTDVFGCEAEAASIAKYIAELRGRGMGDQLAHRIAEKVAIRQAVTPQAVRYISALFSKYGVIAAQPQAFGRPVEL